MGWPLRTRSPYPGYSAAHPLNQQGQNPVPQDQEKTHQPVEGANRPWRRWRLASQPEPDRLGPDPEHALQQTVVGGAHQPGELVGLGAAADRHGEPRDDDRLRVFDALDAVGARANRL